MSVARKIINQVKEKMGRLVEYILLLVSVVLVVSTLTGSTNNYYNSKTLTMPYELHLYILSTRTYW